MTIRNNSRESRKGFARFALTSFVGVVALSASAFAAAPVALLTDATGVSAAPPSYSELQAGTGIQLGKGTVRFVHYQTCKEVEVAGGTLTINADDYIVRGGKIVSEVEQPCPQKVKMAHTTAVAGGLVMRGPIKLTEVGERPTLAIVGPNASTVSSVRFMDGATQLAELPVTGNRVVWAKDMHELSQDRQYTVKLMNGAQTQIEFPIHVISAKGNGAVLIRID